MKTYHTLVLALVAITASPAFAQGKGGGNSSAGNPGKGNNSGFDRPSAPPAASRPDAPDSSNRRTDRPSDPTASLPPDTGKGHGKGDRSASSAAAGLAAAMHDINQTSFAQRRELHESLDLRLKSSRDALKKIQSDAKDLRADARANFKSALDEVKKREGELDNALKASKKSDEARWNGNRDLLSRAYRNHADALARLEAIPRPPRL